MDEDILKSLLEKLVDSINSDQGNLKIRFNQQVKQTKNMSLTGGNGRLYVQPAIDGYDISLSGKSLENEMYGFMRSLCNKDCDGYKQLNKRLGKKDQPFWRVEDFNMVRESAYHYAKTRR